VTHLKQSGGCECQKSRFAIDAKPLARAFCHCTICQQFNDAPYSDVVVVKGSGVTMDDAHKIEFKSYASPPIVKRGKCSECGKPAIEFFRIPPFPQYAIIPSAAFSDTAALPNPQMHIFYDRRVADINDPLPKHSGYFPSQLAFMGCLIRGSFA
jgi:hypothetical protein